MGICEKAYRVHGDMGQIMSYGWECKQKRKH